MVHSNRAASRVLAFALSVVMVMTLMFLPAARARADAAEGSSAELKFSLEGLDLSAKLFVAQEEPVFAILGSLSSQEQVVADAALYLCAQGLILESNSFLQQAVGIDLMQINENLPKSVFAPDSGSAFALDEATYSAFLNGYNGGQQAAIIQLAPQESTFSVQQLEKFEAVGAKYAGLITELFTDNASMSMSPEKVTVGSQQIATSCMTLSLDAEALNTIVSQFLTEAAQDADFHEVVAMVLEQALASMPEEATAELNGMTAADLAAQVWEILPQMNESAAAFFEETGLTCAVSINTSKASGNLIRLALKLTANDDTIGVIYTMGESFAESEIISLAFQENGEDAVKVEYQVAEATDEHYSASISLTEYGDVTAVMALDADNANNSYAVSQALADGTYFNFCAKLTQNDAQGVAAEFSAEMMDASGSEDNYIFSFRWDNTLNRYALSVSNNGEISSLSGVVSEQGNDTVIILDQVDGKPVSGISMVLHGSDSVSVPSYTELLTMSEEDIVNLLNTAITALQSAGIA